MRGPPGPSAASTHSMTTTSHTGKTSYQPARVLNTETTTGLSSKALTEALLSLPAAERGARPVQAARLSVRLTRPAAGRSHRTLAYLTLNFKRTGLTLDADPETLRSWFDSERAHEEVAVYLQLSDDQMRALIGERCDVNLRGKAGSACVQAGIEVTVHEHLTLGTIERRDGPSLGGSWVFVPAPGARQAVRQAVKTTYGKFQGDVINLDLHRVRDVLAQGSGWRLTNVTRAGRLELQLGSGREWSRLLRGPAGSIYRLRQAIMRAAAGEASSTELRGAYDPNWMKRDEHGQSYIPEYQEGCLPVLELTPVRGGVDFKRTSGCQEREVTAHAWLSASETQALCKALGAHCLSAAAEELMGKLAPDALSTGC